MAFPDDDQPHPGVLLYADAFGLRPVLQEMAGELAARGYYVLVPNVFYREGPAPVVELPEHIGPEARPELFAKLLPLIDEFTPERVLSDAAAYLNFLIAQPEVSEGPVATVGYCMGVVLAMRAAAAHPDQVAAVAGFHPGPLVTDNPDSVHRNLAQLSAAVHIGLAENDMTSEAREQLHEALDAADVDYDTEIYPDTTHGFTMSDTDAFDSSALQRHWDRMFSLFARTFGAG